jgi:hypothetical protein
VAECAETRRPSMRQRQVRGLACWASVRRFPGSTLSALATSPKDCPRQLPDVSPRRPCFYLRLL